MSESLILRVRKALSGVVLPDGRSDLITSGVVRGLRVEDDSKTGGAVHFVLEIPAAYSGAASDILESAKSEAAAVDGVTKVNAVATTHNAPKSAPATPTSGHDNPFGINRAKKSGESPPTLPGVAHVIAVASGKGGVGKSTVAANLAIALARTGLAVGLLDADVYGPSAPTLFGINGKAKVEDGKIIPFEKHGVRVMSIGFLVDETQALAWRGPMVMGAVRQLMNDVDWGTLDVLIIDTPPAPAIRIYRSSSQRNSAAP